MTTIKEWAVYVSLSRSLRFPVEDNESEAEFREWCHTLDGKQALASAFQKNMRLVHWPRNTDIDVQEIELVESDVRDSDTDPRV